MARERPQTKSAERRYQRHHQLASGVLLRVGTPGGFTVIELLIIVMIVGILAMLAIPGYLHYREQSRQAEVRRNLGAIFASEVAFYGEN